MNKTIEMSEATAKMVEALQLSYKSMRAAIEGVEAYNRGATDDETETKIYDAYDAYQDALWAVTTSIMKDNALCKVEKDTICNII